MRRLAVFRELIGLFESPQNILDLGCNTGILSNVCNRLGHRTTGIDRLRARQQFCQRFKRGDIFSMSWGPFSLILVCGLLYHLPLDRQQRLAARMAKRYAILDTWRCPDSVAVRQKKFSGLHRLPTASTFSGPAFVHTESSLRRLFASHHVIKWPDHRRGRSFFLLAPRGGA